MKTTESKSIFMRIVYLILGFTTLTLGLIGLVLPILPTAPFLLLTAFFFAKGSKRFHNWFLRTKLYSKHISNFVIHRAMSLSGKLVMLICVSIMLITACLVTPNNIAMMIVLPLLSLIKYSYFIFNVKTVSKIELIQMKKLSGAKSC